MRVYGIYVHINFGITIAGYNFDRVLCICRKFKIAKMCMACEITRNIQSTVLTIFNG